MNNQNGEHEEQSFEEKGRKTEIREAGMGADGEFSMESLQKWFKRAGGALAVCTVAVCLMALLMAGKNQKESLIMEVNSDILMQFSMNRRGSVLKAEGEMARSNGKISMDAFKGKSLGIAVGKIFDRLAENNSLGEDGGVLISVRKSDAEGKASAQKIVKEVQKQAESELQKKESRATVYVFESEESAETKKLASEYGITITKAGFLKMILDENPGITRQEEEELAGYSTKRLIREITERGYKLSLEPIVVKTTYEKASDEKTEEETQDETTEQETESSTARESESESQDPEETTKSDGLSEMERRRKALEAGESVDWVDQERPEEEETESGRKSDEDDESESYGRRKHDTWESGTRRAETVPATENVPETTAPVTETPAPETAPPVTETQSVPETKQETTAASGMLTPETKVPAYRRGPGFEDPDNQ